MVTLGTENMKISLEEYEQRLAAIKLDLNVALIKALSLSNDVGNYDMSKPINILQKEISDLVTGISWILGDTPNDDLKIFHFDIPSFVRIGSPVRKAFTPTNKEEHSP